MKTKKHPHHVHMNKTLVIVLCVGALIVLWSLIKIIVAGSGHLDSPDGRQTGIEGGTYTMARNDQMPQEKVGPFRYHSDFLKISFDVPEGYRVINEYNRLILVNTIYNNDKIIISSIGSNFNTLQDYLNFFDEKKHTIIINEKKLNDLIFRKEYYQSIPLKQVIGYLFNKNLHKIYFVYSTKIDNSNKVENILTSLEIVSN